MKKTFWEKAGVCVLSLIFAVGCIYSAKVLLKYVVPFAVKPWVGEISLWPTDTCPDMTYTSDNEDDPWHHVDLSGDHNLLITRVASSTAIAVILRDHCKSTYQSIMFRL